MFTRRQSSPGKPSSQLNAKACSSDCHPIRSACGQVGPYARELRMPFHWSGAVGGINLSALA